MVVGAPAIYGPVPMLVSISAWLPAYRDAQSRQDCHRMKELLQRDLLRYGGSTGWRLPEVKNEGFPHDPCGFALSALSIRL